MAVCITQWYFQPLASASKHLLWLSHCQDYFKSFDEEKYRLADTLCEKILNQSFLELG